MNADDLRKLTHEELIARAASCGVERPRALSERELIDAILKAKDAPRPRRSQPPPSDRREPGVLSWLGVARDLVTRVVGRGLHLPDAAKLLRGVPRPAPPRPPPPLPTVTLAEIYAAQGYTTRALGVLDEVLAQKPDHPEARALRDRLMRGAPSQPAAPSSTSAVPSSPASSPSSSPSSVPFRGAPSVEALEALEPAVEPDIELPDRYEVDELVALPIDPHTAYAYWELRPLRFAKARRRDPQGHLVLRVLSVRPHGNTTEVASRDVEIDELVGDRFVHELPAGGEIRLCLGWAGPGGFVPLVVGTEIKMPHEVGAAEIPDAPAGAFGLDTHRSGAGVRAMRAYLSRYSASPPTSFADVLTAFEGTLAQQREAFLAGHLGGSSELSRSGASEALRGGASELSRRQNPALSRG